MDKSIKLAAAAAISIAALSVSGVANAEAGADKEKCYGVAKAGANDCGGKLAGHSCAGQSDMDGDTTDFIVVPKGLCERLAGSSLEARANDDHEEEESHEG